MNKCIEIPSFSVGVERGDLHRVGEKLISLNRVYRMVFFLSNKLLDILSQKFVV